MTQGARKQVYPILFAGLFFIIDRICKWLAPASVPIGNTWFGWEYFENTGIAFSLPVSQTIITFATPIILLLLLGYVSGHANRPRIWFGWWILLFGAISNFIDRILFGFVIDYFRIYQGIINIADIMVIIGIISILTATAEE